MLRAGSVGRAARLEPCSGLHSAKALAHTSTSTNRAWDVAGGRPRCSYCTFGSSAVTPFTLAHAPEHHRRAIHTSTTSARQHLLFSGTILDQATTSFVPFKKEWIAALGAPVEDLRRGLSVVGLDMSDDVGGGGAIVYRTLGDRSAFHPGLWSENSNAPNGTRTIEGHEARRLKHVRTRIATFGRNTHGQLGLGFTSHEATWGIVRGGYWGEGGVKLVKMGNAAGLIVTELGVLHEQEQEQAQQAQQQQEQQQQQQQQAEQEKRTSARHALFAFGNHTTGQLGLTDPSSPYSTSLASQTSQSGEPQMELYSAPRRVLLKRSDPSEMNKRRGNESDTDEGMRVMDVAHGLDHTILLIERCGTDGDQEQEVWVTGINTDGQLGLGSSDCSPQFLTRSFLRLETFWDASDPLMLIRASGDTSLAQSRSGRVWTWGNSEYAQAFGGEVQEAIRQPVEVTAFVKDALREGLGPKEEGPRVRDIQLGGSWAVMLDTWGRVFTVGYGPMARGSSNRCSLTLQRVPDLPPVQSLHTSLDAIFAISQTFLNDRDAASKAQSQRLFAWGLDKSGKLGMGLASRLNERDADAIFEGPVDERIDEAKEVHLPPLRLAAALHQRRACSTNSELGRLSEQSDDQANRGPRILDIAAGGECTLLLIEDGLEEVGAWILPDE
ncbi:RCC1/BLIP-II [Ceraceosorus guamensis]|uniref:RCC1/BLIP-II n=1 Tax=Ceraceosorus guamensis TaxID=1522189 RepID=A0A316VVS7_9BASI|nr:RCC1/BLIP-II [Ceraceosorus guamensis]PWN41048.1 RCC1/BLIP-II [Ceraceosorus guamensis]